MQIVITIPDSKKDAVIDAFASQYRYEDTVDGEPNPQTKGVFALDRVKEFIKNTYVAAQVEVDQVAKRATIEAAKTEMDALTVE